MSAERATAQRALPQPVLKLRHAIALIVGIVIGAGIFKAPSLVAQFTGSGTLMLAAWVLGGVVSLMGALCYAELATAYPSAGGDYHFLWRAYGPRLAFLFAWARFTVITTGSIALLAFVFGDYLSQVARLGPFSEALYAGLAVVLLTWINVRGTRAGAATQNWLTTLEVGGLVLVIAAGVVLFAAGSTPAAPAAVEASSAPAGGMFGLAMVFVLLTYGGWNEAAYLGAELEDVSRNMVRALVLSIGLITLLYLAVNLAYLQGLGLAGMAKSNAIGADLMKAAFGRTGEATISLLVGVAALTSINATMIVGARTAYSVGTDWPVLEKLGRWDGARGTPVNALLVQGGLALGLVLLGTAARSGFQTMVDYTAPVFWLFFLLSVSALFILRRRDPQRPRPFRVPLYPVLPAVFCAVCAYMLWSSLAYVRTGAVVGVAVLAAGGLLLLWIKPAAVGAQQPA